MNSHSAVILQKNSIVIVPDGAVDNAVVCEETSRRAAPYQGGHLCTGGTGQVPERCPGGHQRLRVPSQMLPLPEQLSETCRRGSLISTHACYPDTIPIKFVCDSVWNFVVCLAKIPNDQIYLGVTDRQTDRTFIKINQSFAITMSLNSDPKETCAKT